MTDIHTRIKCNREVWLRFRAHALERDKPVKEALEEMINHFLKKKNI